MKQYLADLFQHMEANALEQAGNYAAARQDLINLSIGDHDVMTHHEVIEEAFKDVKDGYTKYTHPLGLKDVREEVVELSFRTTGILLNLDQVMMTVGACHGMTLALKALVNPKDEVMVIAPYFTNYEQQIEEVGGVMKVVLTKEEEDFLPDIERVKEAVTDKTKAIIINSPCNPTGAILSRAFLNQLYQLSKEKDFVILSDEVYTAFVFNRHRYTSMMDIDRDLDHTVVLKSLSKDYAMTGWRIGYLIADASFVSVVRHINEAITYSAPAVSQRAALAAMKRHDTITEGLKKLYEARINVCYKKIQQIPQLSVLPPSGSIYLFVNIKGTGMKAAVFADKLLKEQGVLVVPGEVFGKAYEDYIRIACNKDEVVLRKAFKRIQAFVEGV